MNKDYEFSVTASQTGSAVVPLRRLPLLLMACAFMACSTTGAPGQEDAPETIAGQSTTSAMPQAEVQSETIHPEVQFPPELVGLWIGAPYSCPEPDEGFDGEDIMDIAPDEMFGYEEAYKPTKVTLVSEYPKTWKVEALIDIGPSGVFSEFGPITFSLSDSDGILTTDHKQQTTNFKKCR